MKIRTQFWTKFQLDGE